MELRVYDEIKGALSDRLQHRHSIYILRSIECLWLQAQKTSLIKKSQFLRRGRFVRTPRTRTTTWLRACVQTKIRFNNAFRSIPDILCAEYYDDILHCLFLEVEGKHIQEGLILGTQGTCGFCVPYIVYCVFIVCSIYGF